MTTFPAPTGDPAPPATLSEPPAPHRRGFFISLGVAAAVIAVVGGGIALGGLEERSDGQLEVPVGATMDAGNLVYTFTGATVQRVEGFSGASWEVLATGTVANRNEVPLAPLGGDYGSFLVFERSQNLTAPAEAGSWVIGGAALRDLVPPGDQTMPLQVAFELPLDYSPTDTIGLAVSPMEFTDNSVLGLAGGEKNWNIDSFKTIEYLTLPLERLPDEVSD